MAHCSVKMTNGIKRNAWYLKTTPDADGSAYARAYNFMTHCSAQTCAKSRKLWISTETKSHARRGTLWLSTWLVLRCQPFLKHGQTFCFRCLPFLIASLLSKQKSYFSFSHESSLQICVTVSNNKLKSGTANVPVQPCTIIASTWLCPSSALSTVKNPKQCPHTRSATNSSSLNYSCMLGG